MIEVIIRSGRKELGRIRIENVTATAAEYGDYAAQFGVDTGDGWAVYQRRVEHFPRKRYNVLALLRLALSALEEKDLSLDTDPDANYPDRGWRQLRSGRRE